VSATFERALELTLRFEGGGELVADPADPGGVTRWGISQRSYPSTDILTLTRQQAAHLYERDFWDAGRCGEMPEAVGIAHFDCAVNCGTAAAAKVLQRALGVVADGVLGTVTMAALHARPEREIAEAALLQRLRHYVQIAANPHLTGFLRGWVLRVVQLGEALMQDAGAG